MVGTRVQQRFSTIYFQKAILLLADSRDGEGGLNLWRLSGGDRVAGARRFPRNSENFFCRGHLASNSREAVMGRASTKKRREIQGGGGWSWTG